MTLDFCFLDLMNESLIISPYLLPYQSSPTPEDFCASTCSTMFTNKVLNSVVCYKVDGSSESEPKQQSERQSQNAL